MTGSPRKCKQYCFEEKKLIVETYLSERYLDLTVKDFSKICGVAYGTLREWLHSIGRDVTRIEELRGKRRKRACSGQLQLSEPIRALILHVKGRFSDWGPLKIKQYLFRHEQILVPQSSIYRFLKLQGLVKERVPTSGSKSVHDRLFEYPHPLAAVQLDLMDLTLSSGLKIHLVSFLDDYSRFVLGNRFVSVKTMDEVIAAFQESVCTYGVMERVLTDLGSEFVSWQRFTRFEQLLCDLDVEHIASGPAKPQNQGKVERWHQTVRQALRKRGPLDFSSEAQIWIRALTDMYNYERPHQALGGLTPADRFFGVAEELGAELDRYREGKRANQCVYFSCRIGDRKIVVSGPRADNLSIFSNGVRLDENSPAETQLNRTVCADNAQSTAEDAAQSRAKQKRISQLKKTVPTSAPATPSNERIKHRDP